jgi:hypothetical protein
MGRALVILSVRRNAARRVSHPGAKAAFDRKIVWFTDFLPQNDFLLLRSAAERQIQAKRVNIPVHKRGRTISYHELHEQAPEITRFYRSSRLRNWCSEVSGARVQPTPWKDLSSCSLLIYDQPNDHIGWHFDLNFYKGRHFTALLSLVNTNGSEAESSAQLRIREDGDEKTVSTKANTLVFFEGAYVYHSVTPLREGERRIILSMTFCTDPSATPLQDFMRRGKDVAYFGMRALWSR